MKYIQGEHTVTAKYSGNDPNPFLDAMPEPLSKSDFFEAIRGEVYLPEDFKNRNPEERRIFLIEFRKWFQPMDYMYSVYDILCRAIRSTYQTGTTFSFIRQMNTLYANWAGKEKEPVYATQAYSGAILGIPGIGKTSTIKRCLSTMPQVIIHTDQRSQSCYMKQVVYLTAECPSDCSIRTMTYNILSAIDQAIGSKYFEQASHRGSVAVSSLATRLKIICLNHHVGLIMIDEIQNAIFTAKKEGQVRALIKFLVELTNETATSICFCGTLEAEEVFLRQEHLKRRTRGLRLLPMKYDIVYRTFVKELWNYQVLVERTKITENLMKQIYDLSGGIPDYIIRIFEEAQVQAILSGKEKLTSEMIKRAVLFQQISVPKTYLMSGTSISDFLVEEIRPGTFEGDFPDEPEMEPIKRFYAKKRGRKVVERDESDLIALYHTHDDCNELIKRMEELGLSERMVL